jgi:hypothetical protein
LPVPVLERQFQLARVAPQIPVAFAMARVSLVPSVAFNELFRR